ncbi:MAG: hypothetical protein ACMXYA_03375, partial [Candidatus Woesearchaeota archaeon]
MKAKFTEFIRKNLQNTQKHTSPNTPFCTSDAKKIWSKVVKKIHSYFQFTQTQKILEEFMKFTDSFTRQTFVHELEHSFIPLDVPPKERIQIPYSYTYVTEDEDVFHNYKNQNIPIIFLHTQQDVQDCETYDSLIAVECDKFLWHLEQLPQTQFRPYEKEPIFEKNISLLYSYSPILSYWMSQKELQQEFLDITQQIVTLQEILDTIRSTYQNQSAEDYQKEIDKINEKLAETLSRTQISAIDIFEQNQSQKNHPIIQSIIEDAKEKSSIPSTFLSETYPFEFLYDEFQKESQKIQNEKLKARLQDLYQNSEVLKNIPQIVSEIDIYIYLCDFYNG